MIPALPLSRQRVDVRDEAVLQHQPGGRRSWDPRLGVLGASKEAPLHWLGREEFSLLGAEGLRSPRLENVEFRVR